MDSPGFFLFLLNEAGSTTASVKVTINRDSSTEAVAMPASENPF
jgi:hypothetical protein